MKSPFIRRPVGVLLALLMAFSVFGGMTFTAGARTCEVGDTIQFGTYPQTKVTDSALIAELDAADKVWCDRVTYYDGYTDDYMRFADFFYNGEKYRAVVCDSRRNVYQTDNRYFEGTTYYFRYEPISWRVLDPSEGLVMAENILDAQRFYRDNGSRTIGGQTVFANNYAYSDVRAWLTGDFYDTAFSEGQKEKTADRVLDNSAFSAVYDAASTTDKVFLLSYSEALNASYGFLPSNDPDNARVARGSDYAKGQGLYAYEFGGPYVGNSFWLLRSGGSDEFAVNNFNFEGKYWDSPPEELSCGVRPALKLSNLSSDVSLSTELFSVNACTHETTETRNAAAPTCTQQGYTGDLYCVNCGKLISSGETVPAAHDFEAWVDAVPATCGSDGTVGYQHCRVCGSDFDAEGNKLDSIVDPATGEHVTQLRGAKEATATKDGYTGDEVCTVCGQTIKTGSVIPATGEKEPASADDGVCRLCGEKHGAGFGYWIAMFHTWIFFFYIFIAPFVEMGG